MLTFGVIAESTTDQAVLENILHGFFQGEEGLFVNPVSPPGVPGAPGGWTLVFASLKRGDVEGALASNDYIVIHIDTDVQEEKGFDVPRREGERELDVPEIVERVIARLQTEFDPAFLAAHGERIVYAIAADSIECWLLPLLLDAKKAKKTTGCLAAANAQLRKLDRDGLTSGETKFPAAYEAASEGYTKRKELMKLKDRNPSLGLFVAQLDAMQERRTKVADSSPEP